MLVVQIVSNNIVHNFGKFDKKPIISKKVIEGQTPPFHVNFSHSRACMTSSSHKGNLRTAKLELEKYFELEEYENGKT